MITKKDRIGYISMREHEDGTVSFKFIEERIKSIRIGKKKTSVYSENYRALDAEELESNTKMMSDNLNIVLVREPFITNDALSKHLKQTVDFWNKNGAVSELGNRTRPPKEET